MGGQPEKLFTNLTLKPLEHIFVDHPAVVGLYLNLNLIRFHGVVLIVGVVTSITVYS